MRSRVGIVSRRQGSHELSTDLRTEMRELGTELRADMGVLRADMATSNAESRADLFRAIAVQGRWMVAVLGLLGAIFTTVVLLAG